MAMFSNWETEEKFIDLVERLVIALEKLVDEKKPEYKLAAKEKGKA